VQGSNVAPSAAKFSRAARWKPGETAPAHLTGVLAGDAGFDPLLLTALAQKNVGDLLTGGFPNMVQREIIMANMTPEQQQASVEKMREAEVKHARLAMLAAVGWPFAELASGQWLSSMGGRAPSLFNGGLFDGGVPFFLVIASMGAALLENKYEERNNQRRSLALFTPEASKELVSAGDFGFDPIGLYTGQDQARQKDLRAFELHNGRLAMLAITGFAVQEFVWGKPVIEQTPFFFGR
jgi:light-harvesting complex II chlorophyll a/b binding protein 4